MGKQNGKYKYINKLERINVNKYDELILFLFAILYLLFIQLIKYMHK